MLLSGRARAEFCQRLIDALPLRILGKEIPRAAYLIDNIPSLGFLVDSVPALL